MRDEELKVKNTQDSKEDRTKKGRSGEGWEEERKRNIMNQIGEVGGKVECQTERSKEEERN